MSYIGQGLGAGVRNRYYYTATGGETSLSGADDNGKTLRFADGNYVDVMLNGITLVAGTDYDTDTADTISGLDALTASDVVEIVVYDVFSVADSVSKSDGGTFDGPVTFADATTHQGVATFQAAAVLNAGTTAERPASPATGSVRYNTTLELYEGYNGKEWTALSATKTPDVYLIDNSLRFNDDDSAYLSRTASTGNLRTYTFSAWAKFTGAGPGWLFAAGGSSAPLRWGLYRKSNGQIVTDLYGTGEYNTSNALYRDPSAWYHIVWVVDTAAATAIDRSIIYINGERISDANTRTLALNADTSINSAITHYIGNSAPNTFLLDGYMSDVYFIDGQALDPTSFGEFDDNGVWNPIAYAGTYGTNGFFLEFKTDSALGTDTSGNSNNWTPSGLAGSDQMTDTPSVNYATWNPLDNNGGATLSNGNLNFSGGATAVVRATMAGSGKKFYWEITNGTNVGPSAPIIWGIANASGVPNTHNNWLQAAYFYTDSSASSELRHYQSGSLVQGITIPSSLRALVSGDVLQVAYDGATGKVWMGVNDVWADNSGGTTGDPAAGTNQTFTFNDPSIEMTALREHAGVAWSGALNCGQRPFAYTPPTGFVALSSSNLPAPTIADGKEHFEPLLWTGNGGTQGIGGLEFSPDLVWIKARSNNYDHQLHDTVRGTSSTLFSNFTQAEGSYNTLTSFDAAGFTVDGSTYAGTNGNGSTFVGWSWNAGGTTVTNTDGTRTAQVRANTDAGFSIATYNPALTSGQSCTVGHGLSQAPEIIITKSRSGAFNWWTFTTVIDGSVDYLALNLTTAKTDDSYGLAITSSTFTQNHAYTGGSTSHIAYCFHSVDGFSKFGSYTGNGSADGPFVYTGFRPAFVLVKRTDASARWVIWDAKRDQYNFATRGLFPDLPDAETTAFDVDLVSNGFKLRDAETTLNGSGSTYIYMAFAENPFKTARAR